MPSRFPTLPLRQQGFSLVEILVGMAVGLLGMVVIMQMYSNFENQKRTTTSGDEAQNSGAIGLYQLQRYLQQGGYGFSVLEMMGCDMTLPSGPTIPLAPVTINPATSVIPAGDADTDRLLVVYGTGNGSTVGDAIKSGSGTTYTMKKAATASAGDYVIAQPLSLACTGANALVMKAVASVNTTAKTVTLTSNMAAYDGTLYSFGTPKVLAFAVRSGSLTLCDYMANDCGSAANASNSSIWVPLASDIASLRAQYGRDTSATMDGIVDTYDQSTPATSCGWVKTPALRLALAARGAQRGQQAISTAPTWTGSSGAPFVLTADANWQRYHYKIFETIVPLRNITWMGVVSGC